MIINRALTTGELGYALPVFGFAIDYNRVKVHNLPAFSFQPVGTAITPNGEVYFNAEDYEPDFSIRV